MVESQGPTVITISVVFAVITFIIMALRLWARIFLVQKVGMDDILISVGALLAWAFIAATILSVQHGLGDHYVDVEPRGLQNMISYSQIVWLSSIFYNACLGFIKTSVLALYMRLGDRTLKRLAIIMTCIVAAQASAHVLVCIFQCSPVSAAYDLAITKKKCIDINAFYLANAAVNISTDLLTYTLPIKTVLHLQVPKNQKIGLGVMLSLGLFACISSIIRISYIPQMLTSSDPTWAISGAMYWSVIETNVGIAAASIPSFKVIAKKYAPRLLGSYYESQRYPSGAKHGSKFSQNAFHKMGSQGGVEAGTGHSGHGSVQLRSMNRDPNDTFRDVKGGIQTRIEQDGASNSSEEALTLPDGRIGVRTQIVTQYEPGSATRTSSHSENSLYEAKQVQGRI
ncbi:integral membrane protein [Botryosphaeria dothidea]|uniref:Integral membrane protein n=1 Tax=Botryosphaeria dothidea TaxID=55169 RepID=A0A8H4N1Y9_9PEZI|nr:integral membrane protein [Botryosphaeria dothidea]KAF4305980.1 integral membrane protein [Botryosphaeria dothidea]